MTRFCIITDETRHIKMAIVDRNVTPILSVNDPVLMLAKPKGLTAATGMDALTHAVEAYAVSYTHLDVYKRQPVAWTATGSIISQ